MVFDCLYVNSHRLLGNPLEARQKILEKTRAALACDTIRSTGCISAQSRLLMKACSDLGFEGGWPSGGGTYTIRLPSDDIEVRAILQAMMSRVS
jgi:hypothetical protein